MKREICDSKDELGNRAAQMGAEAIRQAIQRNGMASIIVATGASQFETLAALVRAPEMDWSRVTGFHLDEYLGIPVTHRASFRGYLKERFVDLVPLADFHYIDGEQDPETECQRLGDLIGDHVIDVAFIGIGENGHLAFNDPPANFDTETPFITVELDDACRRQQRDEGWFDSMDEVPRRAISMSVRQIMKSRHLVCSVPDQRKATAVKNSVLGPVHPDVPASILQQHSQATLLLDRESASLLS